MPLRHRAYGTSLDSRGYKVTLEQYLMSKNMIISNKSSDKTIKSKVRRFTADIVRAYSNIDRKLRNQRDVELSVEIFGFFFKEEPKADASQEDKNEKEGFSSQADSGLVLESNEQENQSNSETGISGVSRNTQSQVSKLRISNDFT